MEGLILVKRINFWLILIGLVLALCCLAGSGLAAELIIPSSVNTIEAEVFYGNTSLDEVVLPEDIKALGDRSFAYSSVKRINLPASLTTFGVDVFLGVEGLQVTAEFGTPAYAWADGLGLIDHSTPVGDFLFEKIDDTTCKIVGYAGNGGAITLPTENADGLKVALVEEHAFKDHTEITEVTIPSGVGKIGQFAFEGCNGIVKLYVASGVELAPYAFKALSGLKEVSLPVDIITTWSFQDVTNVETIHYLKGQTGIMPDWWTAERHDVYYEGDYRGRLEFYSASSLKSIYFEEGITRISNYAFYGRNVYGGGYNFALQNVYLPTTLESIGKYAFNTLPNIKHIKIPDRCRQIGEGNFLNCGDLIVVIGRSNDAARLYCVNNLIPYAIGGPLEIKAYQGYGDWTNEAGEYGKRLYLLGSASGGLKPYTYRFTVTENGESTVTDWQEECYAYLPLPSSTDFSIRAEVIDSEGNYACSDDVAGQEEQVSEKPMKTLMFEQFATLANNATDPMSLRGAIFNDGLPETQWLLNLAVDVFHADLSAFQTQGNKQAYLFKAAFDAAADGNAITMANMEKMPSEVKLLIKGNAINDDLYIDGLEALANQSGGSVASYSQGLKKILKDFKQGKIGSDDIRLSVEQMGIPSDMQKAVTQNIELMGIISTINKVYDYGTFAINSFNDVLNQIYLLNAMDMNQLEVIAYIYKDSDDFDTQVVGIRLMDIIQADTYEERVALVAGGSLGILALDKILDQFSLASTPVFKFIYAAVDYVTGAGNYSKYMSELQWACDALMSSHAGLTSLCSDFTESPTDYRFELLLDRYITYAELAATVEEAYVNVCKIDMDVLRPDYVTQAAQKASREAELYRRLAESLRKLKVLWNAKNYRGMIAQMMECTGIQEYLNNYAYNSNFGYDYHQQGGW